MHTRVKPHGHNYRTLVGQHPYGTSPDFVNTALGQPPLLRRGFEQAIINQGGARYIMARSGVVPPSSAQIGSLTVADNDFATGVSYLELGVFKLIAGLDFLIGAAVADTATNLAAAISNLPGYLAMAIGPVVTLQYAAGPMDLISFRARYEGTKINFTPLVPETGFLAPGAPAAVAPLIF